LPTLQLAYCYSFYRTIFFLNQRSYLKIFNSTTKIKKLKNIISKQAKNPKGVVFYLKGNSKSIKGWGKFAVDFTRHGYDVIMVDYRGFGKSTGRRTQKAVKRDMQVVYNKIKEKVSEKYIILYGRSLGDFRCTLL